MNENKETAMGEFGGRKEKGEGEAREQCILALEVSKEPSENCSQGKNIPLLG